MREGFSLQVQITGKVLEPHGRGNIEVFRWKLRITDRSRSATLPLVSASRNDRRFGEWDALVERAVAYVLSYVMLTGFGQREALTAAQAVIEYRDLQSAGGAAITIVGPRGEPVTFAELVARAADRAEQPNWRWHRWLRR